MKERLGRLARRAAAYAARTLSLLLAVSAISFALVCASPVDPVQQYILGLGTAVSPEQRGNKSIEIFGTRAYHDILRRCIYPSAA